MTSTTDGSNVIPLRRRTAQILPRHGYMLAPWWGARFGNLAAAPAVSVSLAWCAYWAAWLSAMGSAR